MVGEPDSAVAAVVNASRFIVPLGGSPGRSPGKSPAIFPGASPTFVEFVTVLFPRREVNTEHFK